MKIMNRIKFALRGAEYNVVDQYATGGPKELEGPISRRKAKRYVRRNTNYGVHARKVEGSGAGEDIIGEF